MTTIAYDGRYVAADCQGTYFSNQRGQTPRVKLITEGDLVFALVGSNALMRPMIAWYRAGCEPNQVPADPDNETSFIVFRGGKCYSFCSKYPYPVEFLAKEAWGSGQSFALGAMAAGADAKQAVEIAMRYDVFTGGPVQVIDLHEIQKIEKAA